MSKSRAYCFTLNNYTDLEHTTISEMECRYLCIGKEIGESGTPHLQGYVYFASPRSLNSIKKLMPRAHLEVAKGNPVQASDYCKKDGDFIESGELPAQGKRSDIDNVRDMIKEGLGMRDIVDVASSYQSIKCAESVLKYKEKKRDFKTEVTWLWGPSGSGKTRYAYDNHSPDEIHLQISTEKWYEGYDSHPIVIIDEVSNETSYSMLKLLCDRFPARVEYKGGSRSFLAKKIYITSLSHPADLFYSYPENGKEMLRRIDKIISLA